MFSERQSFPYKDDPAAIRDESDVLRRVHPAFVSWEPFGPRVTSQAFQDYPTAAAERLGFPAPAMSVCLAEVLNRSGFGPEKLIEEEGPAYGVVAISVAVLRGLGEGAMPWPTPNEPWHAIVFVATGEKRRRVVRSAIADAARWVLYPSK